MTSPSPLPEHHTCRCGRPPDECEADIERRIREMRDDPDRRRSALEAPPFHPEMVAVMRLLDREETMTTTPTGEHHTWTHNPLVRQLQEENQSLRASLENMLDWANDANDWRVNCCGDESLIMGGRHLKCAEWIKERDEARAALSEGSTTNG